MIHIPDSELTDQQRAQRGMASIADEVDALARKLWALLEERPNHNGTRAALQLEAAGKALMEP